MRIDLNSDMGESFGAWNLGDDAALLRSISSANIACGFHAGDPRVMLRTVEACAEAGVAVGAHPGFPDLVGFGRRAMQLPAAELRTDILYLVGALQAMCAAVGVPLHHVKPHGAMYTMAAVDDAMSKAIVTAVAEVMDTPRIYAQPESVTARAAAASGVEVWHEVFADRAYLSDGQLTPRSQPGAVLHDVDAIVDRAIRMVKGEPIATSDGATVVLPCDTICVHGDTVEAVDIALALRSALVSSGFTVSSR